MRSKNTNKEGEELLLRVGCSPDKEDLFNEISRRFNSLQFRTHEQQVISEILIRDNQELIESALRQEVEIICPDSTVWAEQIETEWRNRFDLDRDFVNEICIFAVSPLVIAMRPSSARRLGYPSRPIGWTEILTEAQENPEFKWTHPHIRSTAGLLTAFAEFFVAAGKPEGFSEEHIGNPEVLESVRKLEQSIEQYGPSEAEIINHALSEGEWRIDAFVAQERLVLTLLKEVSRRNQPILIYPKEGAAWIDHPLILLSHEGVSSTFRRAYGVFRDYLLSADVQSFLNQAGFRAAGPHIRSYFSKPSVSEVFAERLYSPSVPVFHSLSAPVLRGIAKNWYTVKRRAAIYLLADISGSMRGDKLDEAKKGMLAFLDEFGDLKDYVGLITFESSVGMMVPIGPLTNNIDLLRNAIISLIVRGDTSLLDAVSMAYDELHQYYPEDPIRAIIVMTDGQENASSIDLSQLMNKIASGNNANFPVAIFGLAYGSDADLPLLRELSGITGGSSLEGSISNIEVIYRRMSTFV